MAKIMDLKTKKLGPDGEQWVADCTESFITLTTKLANKYHARIGVDSPGDREFWKFMVAESLKRARRDFIQAQRGGFSRYLK